LRYAAETPITATRSVIASLVDAIKRQLGTYRNLSLVGRGGTFRYNNSDHAIETGLLAARKALGEVVDLDEVNEDSAYLEVGRAPVLARQRLTPARGCRSLPGIQ